MEYYFTKLIHSVVKTKHLVQYETLKEIHSTCMRLADLTQKLQENHNHLEHQVEGI